MRFLVTLLFAAGFILLLPHNTTRADLAVPKSSTVTRLNTKTVWSNLTVEPATNGNEARLQISQEALTKLQAVLQAQAGSQSSLTEINSNSTRTIMAGLSLFAAIAFGGIWLVRSQSSRGQKTFAALLLGTTVLTLASMIAQGNAAPPFLRWRSLTTNLTQGRPTTGEITIEVVKEGEGMKLILPVAQTKRTGDE
jgi:cell division protein FtsL